MILVNQCAKMMVLVNSQVEAVMFSEGFGTALIWMFGVVIVANGLMNGWVWS